ncbi:hypothetical protein CARUB_v10019153mg [Capsella rubella]|uniref:S-protein homolog n=1 Tax=Capsella rubella TaxID=81985 RepID=R0FTI2_9BRAS|nr:hypothetical protein CARUB_v10019153mg [Capsella rubella]
MKNLSVFIFVFSIYMLGHVSGGMFRIGNELKSKKLLWVRCYSKDDVIGPNIIPIGEDCKVGFMANFWGTTRFMCTLKQGPHYKHYQNFTAFRQFNWFDEGNLWDWRAREDGIYLNREGIFKHGKMHKVYDWLTSDVV